MKEKFIQYIESKTHKPLILSGFNDKILNESIRGAFAVTVNGQSLSSLLNESQSFDCIFEQWQSNFRIVSNLHSNSPVLRIEIMGITQKISENQIQETISLFEELKTVCEFQPFRVEYFL